MTASSVDLRLVQALVHLMPPRPARVAPSRARPAR